MCVVVQFRKISNKIALRHCCKYNMCVQNSISDINNTCKKQTFCHNHVNAYLLPTGTIKQDLDSIEGLSIPKKDILNHFSFIDNNENSKTETDLMQTNYNDQSLTQERHLVLYLAPVHSCSSTSNGIDSPFLLLNTLGKKSSQTL